MTAFFVASVVMKDPAKFQEYGAAAGPTVAAHGGEIVLKGKASAVLAGSSNADAAGVIKFPSIEALNTWYNSSEYQALIPLRDEAVDMTLATFEVPA